MSINPFEEFSKCQNSFAYFAKTYVKFTHPVRGLVPFNLYGYQERLISAYEKYPYVMVKKFRQSGVTTTSVLWLLWKCMFFNNMKVLVISKTSREAAHTGKLATLVINNLPDWLKPPLKIDNNHEKEFSITGSKMCFYQCQAGRSRSVDYLFIDEAAFIKNMEGHWRAMYPIVACGGKAFIVSTTNGIGNWFHDTWVTAQEGKNQFHLEELHYYEHPDFNNAAWVEEMKKQLGEKSFRQEVLCEFIGDDIPELTRMAMDYAESKTNQELARRLLSLSHRFRKGDFEDYAFLIEAYKRLSMNFS